MASPDKAVRCGCQWRKRLELPLDLTSTSSLASRLLLLSRGVVLDLDSAAGWHRRRAVADEWLRKGVKKGERNDIC